MASLSSEIHQKAIFESHLESNPSQATQKRKELSAESLKSHTN
jgi:hypothetical protein